MPYPCTWKRQLCHRPRQTAGPSSRAPETQLLHLLACIQPYPTAQEPSLVWPRHRMTSGTTVHTLLAGAGLGEAALGGGPRGLSWVYDLGAYRTQGGAVDIGSDQSPSDLFLRPPGRTLTWEPGTSGSSSGTNQGVARSVVKSLHSGIGGTCAHTAGGTCMDWVASALWVCLATSIVGS